MKKLVCDRCGKEFTEKEDVDLAIEGKEAWAVATQARGAKPRGIIPCEHYIRCGGEMKMVTDNRFIHCYRWLVKLFNPAKKI
ncbi:hypothetical protein ACFLXU_00150 [Chloroflexota bacterium]